METKELEGLNDIKLMVNDFYQTVLCDENLGPIFDYYDLDWSKHLDTMYSFWNSIMFSAGSYRGNPLKTHFEVDRETPLNKTHFEIWLKIFNETVDKYFHGEKAEMIKYRAAMQAKNISARILGN